MSQRVTRLNLSDRIAQLVAYEMMRKLGWSNQPELLQLSTPKLLEYRRDTARLLVEFELSGQEFVYRILVTLTGFDGCWEFGSVYALHGCVQTVYFYTTFNVNAMSLAYVDGKGQCVVLEKEYLTKEMDYETQVLFEL